MQFTLYQRDRSRARHRGCSVLPWVIPTHIVPSQDWLSPRWDKAVNPLKLLSSEWWKLIWVVSSFCHRCMNIALAAEYCVTSSTLEHCQLNRPPYFHRCCTAHAQVHIRFPYRCATMPGVAARTIGGQPNLTFLVKLHSFPSYVPIKTGVVNSYLITAYMLSWWYKLMLGIGPDPSQLQY